VNRLLVRIQIYESMLRDSFCKARDRDAERRRREAEQRTLSGLSWSQLFA